jgi:hypothetical protein
MEVAGYPVVARHLLALGLQAWDPLTDRARESGVRAELEGGGRIDRHTGGRFAVRHRPGLAPTLTVRLVDAAGRRIVVPRRLELPVPGWDEVEAASLLDDPPAGLRTHRVGLYPGATAAVGIPATVRGRVVAAGHPVRWARIEARRRSPGGVAEGAPLGVAHGDDRGEFVLVVRFPPTAGPLLQPVPLSFRVYGRPPAPLPTEEDAFAPGTFDAAPTAEPARDRYLRGRVRDPLWDLPIETVNATAGAAYADVVAGVTAPTALSRSQAPDGAYDLAVRGDRAPLDLEWVA